MEEGGQLNASKRKRQRAHSRGWGMVVGHWPEHAAARRRAAAIAAGLECVETTVARPHAQAKACACLAQRTNEGRERGR